MTLTQQFLGKGCCFIILDNFFISSELAELLINFKTEVYGAIRPTIESFQTSVKNEKKERGCNSKKEKYAS